MQQHCTKQSASPITHRKTYAKQRGPRGTLEGASTSQVFKSSKLKKHSTLSQTKVKRDVSQNDPKISPVVSKY